MSHARQDCTLVMELPWFIVRSPYTLLAAHGGFTMDNPWHASYIANHKMFWLQGVDLNSCACMILKWKPPLYINTLYTTFQLELKQQFSSLLSSKEQFHLYLWVVHNSEHSTCKHPFYCSCWGLIHRIMNQAVCVQSCRQHCCVEITLM